MTGAVEVDKEKTRQYGGHSTQSGRHMTDSHRVPSSIIDGCPSISPSISPDNICTIRDRTAPGVVPSAIDRYKTSTHWRLTDAVAPRPYGLGATDFLVPSREHKADIVDAHQRSFPLDRADDADSCRFTAVDRPAAFGPPARRPPRRTAFCCRRTARRSCRACTRRPRHSPDRCRDSGRTS
jgi:hypothetical protein